MDAISRSSPIPGKPSWLEGHFSRHGCVPLAFRGGLDIESEPLEFDN